MDWAKLIGPLALTLVNGCALQAGADLRTDGEPVGDEAGFDTGAVSLEDAGPDTVSPDGTTPDTIVDAVTDTTVVADVSPDALADIGSDTVLADGEPDSAPTDGAVGLDSAPLDDAAGDTSPDVVSDSAPVDTEVVSDTVAADSGADAVSSDVVPDGAIEVEIFDAGPSLCAVDGDCPVGGFCRPVEGRFVCVNL